VRGGLGYLSTRSPGVRRLALEMTDRQADAIADGRGMHAVAVAKVHAIALAWVFQTITDESGRGTAAGLSPAQIADTLAPAVTAILDQLGAWPSNQTPRSARRRNVAAR
jgi:hypothetical protein